MRVLVVAVLFGIKVAGVDFVPKDLIFAPVEPKSRASAEGPLPNECKWDFMSETRLGRQEDGQGCVRYFYKTTISLTQTCPAPHDKPAGSTSERITSQGPFCPDHGKVQPPSVESKALSSGTTGDGKHHDIVVQPDGTRIELIYDGTGVMAVIAFPDGAGDTLKLP
jgi:hypothetical protein